MADSKPMEPIFEALKIIEDATKSSNFLVNKRQCKSLEYRLASVIGEKLKELSKEFDCNQMGYPAFDMLLTALRKATALLSKYTDTKESMPSVLTRSENREAFREIHAELDMLNSQFPFDEYPYASESMLTGDADEDKQELPGNLGQTAAVASANMEKMKVVVAEKINGRATEDDLPSYLNIDTDSVEIKDPVRNPERLSDHDDKNTDGWALVRFGTYLGWKFAVKVFNSGDASWNRSELLKEVRSLMQLHHPHVVQLMGFAQDEEKCIILMELMDTDLRHFMNQRSRDGKRPFARSEEMDIITQIARGLLYLHEQGYVHGELKCSNFLVKQIGEAIDVKISDLRSSQKLGVWDAVLFKERSLRKRPRWTAPEVTRYGESLEPTHEELKKADVYSFGMVCFEVVTGKLPFQDIRGELLKRRIAAEELEQELPADIDPRLRALIEACWAREPQNRPTVEEICAQLDVIRSSQPGFFAPVRRRLRALLAISRKPRALQLHGTSHGGAGAPGGDGKPLTLSDVVSIDPVKLKIERLLGQGASAKVYEATWLGCKFAVKSFKSSFSPTAVQAELKFLIELRHPCLVRLMGMSVSKSPPRYSIVMELMASDLRKLIDTRMGTPNRNAPFDLLEAVYIITRIAMGMAFLHARDVVHLDLKALNVLVPDYPGSIDVKITDFGVSQFIDPKEDPTPRNVGTRFWRAPELLQSPPQGQPLRNYDLKSADVYSFAMTSYEVLTGKVPLDDEEVKSMGLAAAKDKVVAGELRPKLPGDLNSALKELIEECWAGEPGKRPTFSTICEKLQHIQP